MNRLQQAALAGVVCADDQVNSGERMDIEAMKEAKVLNGQVSYHWGRSFSR
jgi:hypothetical protein